MKLQTEAPAFISTNELAPRPVCGAQCLSQHVNFVIFYSEIINQCVPVRRYFVHFHSALKHWNIPNNEISSVKINQYSKWEIGCSHLWAGLRAILCSKNRCNNNNATESLLLKLYDKTYPACNWGLASISTNESEPWPICEAGVYPGSSFHSKFYGKYVIYLRWTFFMYV